MSPCMKAYAEEGGGHKRLERPQRIQCPNSIKWEPEATITNTQAHHMHADKRHSSHAMSTLRVRARQECAGARKLGMLMQPWRTQNPHSGKHQSPSVQQHAARRSLNSLHSMLCSRHATRNNRIRDE